MNTTMRRLMPRPLVRFLKKYQDFTYQKLFGFGYSRDGLMVKGKNVSFLSEDRFASAWQHAVEENKVGWSNDVPDIRWRAHIALWAAEHGRKLEGDFVECGVHTGILSHAICKYLDFGFVDKKFYLFDTFEGIPTDKLIDSEKIHSDYFNEKIYFDCYSIVKESFSKYSNVELVKGYIPDTFKNVDINKVSYLSIDLNNAYAERQAIEFFWDKLVSGAIVVLDDYGCVDFIAQKETIDEFLSQHNVTAATLPTGQGLIVKP